MLITRWLELRQTLGLLSLLLTRQIQVEFFTAPPHAAMVSEATFMVLFADETTKFNFPAKSVDIRFGTARV